ncbi:MAG TPA: polyprenyl synthetase family protein [Gemmatimonadales bacterium]|nr:polyprenyl synthetase family protein [Gemmatimonadales bacterium]
MKTSIADRALEAYLTDTRTRVDAVLERWCTRAESFWPAPVPAAVRYSVLSEGKRLRPTLVFASHEAMGGAAGTEGIADLAAAVEVVHAYSLIHDDLPCMDNDDLRRGRPTVHRAFDVATATSAGFHMVGLAARVLVAGLDALDLPADRRRAVALELFRAAGGGGMIGGQVLDLEAEGRHISLEALREVHQRKTGALIAAACVIGGLAAGGVSAGEHLAALRAYGEAIGLAFQIADDVLDATATSAQLGKTAGRDAALAKSTFVSVLGVGAARAEAERLAAQAVDRLRHAALVSPTLVALAHYIVTRPN